MKAIFICVLFALLHFGFAGPLKFKDGNVGPIPAESAWVRSQLGLWLGSHNVWYKMDKKTNSIQISYNKKKWTSAEGDAVWNDNKGRWLLISNNKLMCSETGKYWFEITNRTWQDVNGVWYRFDNEWNLWEVKL